MRPLSEHITVYMIRNITYYNKSYCLMPVYRVVQKKRSLAWTQACFGLNPPNPPFQCWAVIECSGACKKNARLCFGMSTMHALPTLKLGVWGCRLKATQSISERFFWTTRNENMILKECFRYWFIQGFVLFAKNSTLPFLHTHMKGTSHVIFSLVYLWKFW